MNWWPDDSLAGRGSLRTLLIVACVSVAACKPAPPPDLARRQRDALESAKKVDDVIQKQADDQRRRIDESER